MTLKMSDIAKLAHVSKATVSLAINNKPGVSETTRTKILTIIEEAGYEPLRQSKVAFANQIGEITFLVVTTSGLVQDNYRSLPFFNNLISALSAEIGRLNGSLKTVTIDVANLPQELKTIKADRKVLVLGTDLTEQQARLIQQKVRHVVFLDTYFSDIDADFVTMDNYQGARLAGQYILEQGYKNIGYFASNKLMSNFSERRRGFRAILAEANLKISNDHFYFIAPAEIEPNGLQLDTLIRRKLPSAIFCEDDYIALRLIKAARVAHIKVPDQLAIMGFDDIYEGTLITPELSTIHVNVEQMAGQALQQLINQFTHTDWSPQKSLIATKLIPRQSL